MPSSHSAHVKIGTDIFVGETTILHFAYRVLWDRGSSLDLLIYDPDCAFHGQMEKLGGSPTPPVEFYLEYDPSQGDRFTYKNKGQKRTLYIIKVGQVLTPSGLCMRIRAVDKGSILLRETVLNTSASGVKASEFVSMLTGKVSISSKIPVTGDNAGVHRAVRAKPIEAIRYELDRVLSGSGKPISLQFDDRADQQKLVGYEELYDTPTQAHDDCMTGGGYTLGLGVPANNGVAMSYGNSIYHWEMDQDYRPAIWGHFVSVDHLNVHGNMVTGEMKAKMASKLGVQGDALMDGGSRLHIPMAPPDSATTDDYYAKAVMVNSVFHTEMKVTSGWILVDADFKGYDSFDILNRKHVIISITGGSNKASGNALIPNQAVIMGWEHRLNRGSAYTKLFLRRGT